MATLNGGDELLKRLGYIRCLPVESRGCVLFIKICKLDLEGIVAKHKDGLYSPSAKWIKVKNPCYTQGEGRQELFERRLSATAKMQSSADTLRKLRCLSDEVQSPAKQMH